MSSTMSLYSKHTMRLMTTLHLNQDPASVSPSVEGGEEAAQVPTNHCQDDHRPNLQVWCRIVLLCGAAQEGQDRGVGILIVSTLKGDWTPPSISLHDHGRQGCCIYSAQATVLQGMHHAQADCRNLRIWTTVWCQNWGLF